MHASIHAHQFFLGSLGVYGVNTSAKDTHLSHPLTNELEVEVAWSHLRQVRGNQSRIRPQTGRDAWVQRLNSKININLCSVQMVYGIGDDTK